jgi:uncharacterized membrane protein YdbT with pleckstrin-like domain
VRTGPDGSGRVETGGVDVAVADSLIADEKIVFESKKSWLAPIRASIVAGLLVLGALVLRAIAPSGDGVFGWIGGVMDLIAIGLLIAGIAWIAYNIVAWRTAEFAVTNMRVLREEGLITRRSSTTLLSSLSDVRSNVGFIGGRLGFGDIILLTQSGGAGEDRFLMITKPVEFRNAVMTQKMAAPPERAAVAAPAATAGAPSAPAQPTAPAAATPTSNATADAATLLQLADLRDKGAITAEEYEAKKSEILARM